MKAKRDIFVTQLYELLNNLYGKEWSTKIDYEDSLMYLDVIVPWDARVKIN